MILIHISSVRAIMAEENKPQNIINAIMQCDTTDITFINGSAEQYNDKYVDVLNESALTEKLLRIFLML